MCIYGIDTRGGAPESQATGQTQRHVGFHRPPGLCRCCASLSLSFCGCCCIHFAARVCGFTYVRILAPTIVKLERESRQLCIYTDTYTRTLIPLFLRDRFYFFYCDTLRAGAKSFEPILDIISRRYSGVVAGGLCRVLFVLIDNDFLCLQALDTMHNTCEKAAAAAMMIAKAVVRCAC